MASLAVVADGDGELECWLLCGRVGSLQFLLVDGYHDRKGSRAPFFCFEIAEYLRLHEELAGRRRLRAPDSREHGRVIGRKCSARGGSRASRGGFAASSVRMSRICARTTANSARKRPLRPG